MISKYDSFKEDLILEKMLTESIIYYHPNLLKIFRRLSAKSKIARDLLNFQGQNAEGTFTFIDKDYDSDGYLTFIAADNANKLLKIRFNSLGDEHWAFRLDKEYNLSGFEQIVGIVDNGIFSSSTRNQIKLGKFINKLFPGKYTDKEIEEFVNLFKSDTMDIDEIFEIVQGDDIRYWYNCGSYSDNNGNLGSSCMKDPSKSIFFDIYTENPDTCRMLILTKNGALLGRALIWKLNSVKFISGDTCHDQQNIEYFMDRQYTSRDADINKFKDYANKQGWAYKTKNNYKEFKNVTFNGSDLMLDMAVKVEAKEYNYYPFLDTFRRYDLNTGMLYNDDGGFEYSDRTKCIDLKGGQYVLRSTGGSRYTI